MATAVPLKQVGGELSEFDTTDTIPSGAVSGLATIATSGLITDATGTLGTANGGTGGATVQAARTNLLLTQRQTSGDADFTIAGTSTASARQVQLTATLTANRTWTLPAANAFQPGETLWLEMGNGSTIAAALASFNLILAPGGTDKINGSATSLIIRQSNAIVLCTTNGSNGWIVGIAQPSAAGFTSGGLDAANTFAPTSPVSSYLFTHTLTAARAFNLAAGYPAGWTVTVTRTAASTGAFNLTVQDATTTANAKALAVSQWVEFVSDGTSWNEAAFGSL